MSPDRRLIYFTAFVRATATGMVGVLLGIHLAVLGLPPDHMGKVIGAGLAGAAVAALVATLAADRHGRRRMLLELSLLGSVGTAAAALASTPLLIGIIAFLGMLNGMGRDRGAALVIEQAMLPATIDDRQRTQAFAWYNVLQDAGHALGGLLAGLPTLLRHGGIDRVSASRTAFAIPALLLLLSAFAYRRLSPAVEGAVTAKAPLAPASRRTLTRISALFALDSLGGGFLTTALLGWWFYDRFAISQLTVGALFFAARVANAFSHLGAAWLARRIGLVKTMVFTHVPSSLLLVTVAWAPNFTVAALLFLLREGLVEMDVPTRQSYVMAVVRPEERTFASGVTHLVRMAAWAVAPSFAGLFAERFSTATPLYVGAALKIAYDVLLYVAQRRQRPPEEVP